MTEAMIQAWLSAHPFTKYCLTMVVGSIAASIKHDRSSYAAAKAADPTVEFKWGVAVRNYTVGALMALGGVLGAEILHLLGVAV